MLFQILFFLYLNKASALVNDYRPEFFDLNDAKQLFNDFIETFDRHYDNEREYEHRLEIFTKNLEDINNRNKNTSTEVYGITQFSDMTNEEFTRDYTGLKWNTYKEDLYEEKHDLKPMLSGQEHQAPEQWDWRNKGVVTEVSHQGRCGSCWSFSAVGCVESQYAIKHKDLYRLSEQQLVDCFYEGGGCITGSFPHLAFNAAAKMTGLMTDSDYPYIGSQGKCRFDRRRVAVQVNGGRVLRISNEEQLKNLVYEYGPVSIGIAARQGFSVYKGGITTPEHLDCTRNYDINHAVLLIGYGTEDGVPYWTIKNSYGTNWGEYGYMRLIRGKNTCNILQYVAIADVS